MAYLIPPTEKAAKKKARRKKNTSKWVLITAGVAVIGVLALAAFTLLTKPASPSLQNTETMTPLPLNLAAIETSTPLPLSTATQQPIPSPLASTALPTTPPLEIVVDDAQLQQAQSLAALVNTDRARIGLSPLTLNPLLIEAARIHSRDMAQGDFMSHVGSDDSAVTDRVNRVGYAWTSIGENVLQRWDINAEQAYQQWWNSPPHQANMMDAKFTELGLAYDVAESGRVYYAMVLGTQVR